MLEILRKGWLATSMALVIFVLPGCTEQPFMTILYEESGGLEPGNKIVYKGTVIGQVTDVALKPRPSGSGGMFHVGVAIEQDYRTMLSHQMDYVVESVRAFGKEKQIQVNDARADVTLRFVEQGDLVVGAKSLWQQFTNTLSGLVSDFGLTMEDAGDALNDLIDRAEEAFKGADRSMVDDLLHDLEDFTEDAAEKEEQLLKDIEAYLKGL